MSFDRFEYERELALDYAESIEHPRMWCKDCKEVVEVKVIEDFDVFDGRTYKIAEYWECPEHPLHEIEEIRKCPICGEDMGESDEFCPACYDEANQYLTHMRDSMCLTQDQFEDIVCNVLGM